MKVPNQSTEARVVPQRVGLGNDDLVHTAQSRQVSAPKSEQDHIERCHLGTAQLMTYKTRLRQINGAEVMDVGGADGFELAADVPGLQAQRTEVMSKIDELENNVRAEEEKFARWKQENIRYACALSHALTALALALAHPNNTRPR